MTNPAIETAAALIVSGKLSNGELLRLLEQLRNAGVK